jgi:cell division protein FtsQ
MASDPSRRARRAFARRIWARRWLTWRYVLAGLLVLVLVVGSVWLVYFSSYLALKGADVTGTRHLTTDEVLAAADLPVGDPLARVDADAVARRVRAMAYVKSVEVTREWPDKLRIVVTERTAVAVVDLGGTLRGLDADGVVFSSYRQAPPRLPVVRVSGDPGQDALREAARVVAALPRSLSSRVDHLEVATVDQISLALTGGKTVVWGSADQSALKAEVIGPLLKQPGSVYDVSAPGQPTITQ